MKQKYALPNYEYYILDTETEAPVDITFTRANARKSMADFKHKYSESGQKFAIIQRKYALTIERKVR